MGQMSVVRAGWRRFRGLAGWMQLVIALLAALVAVSPFTSEGDRQTVAATGPSTTPAPATTSTSTLQPGIPAPGEETAVVRVIDGDSQRVAARRHASSAGLRRPAAVLVRPDPGLRLQPSR
jgi:hypothetical protein